MTITKLISLAASANEMCEIRNVTLTCFRREAAKCGERGPAGEGHHPGLLRQWVPRTCG